MGYRINKGFALFRNGKKIRNSGFVTLIFDL